MIATTAYLIALLVDHGVDLAAASAALGVMGLGKVAGRLLLLGPIGRQSLTPLAAIATAFSSPDSPCRSRMTASWILFPTMFVVGAASGATTVLRPLIVVDLVGAAPFAATNARIQRASTLARAAAPLVLGVAATAFGWPIAWAGCLAAFAFAGERYLGARSIKPRLSAREHRHRANMDRSPLPGRRHRLLGAAVSDHPRAPPRPDWAEQPRPPLRRSIKRTSSS